MTETTLTALIRYYTRTNSTTLPNSDLQPLMNAAKDEISSLISLQTTLFILRTTANLTASVRRYAFPADVLNHIISVEIAFNQNSPIEYLKADKIMREHYGKSLTEANITNDFSNSLPKYFIWGRVIYFLTGALDSTTIGGATITNGIRITYRKYPADFSASLNGTSDLEDDPTTTTFGFPRQFHELLARRTGIIWKSGRPKPIPLSELEKNYERDLQTQLNAVSQDDYSESVVSSLPSDNGEDY